MNRSGEDGGFIAPPAPMSCLERKTGSPRRPPGHQEQDVPDAEREVSRERLAPARLGDVGIARCDDRRVLLNHIALTVSNRERSAAFYGEHFGLTARVHDDEHLLILGSPEGSLLALSEGPVPAELPRTNHFGFQLKDSDEVRSAREQLRVAGVPETEWQDDGGFVRVQVADPDGYMVELFAY
jgi:catechol 2,3-dioxygenase-like lactoylglutathione lyase family enzyme